MWKSVASWVSGIAASVIAALLVWQLTKPPHNARPGPRPPPAMGELQMHTNLQGNDIANLDNSSITTAGDCSMLCQRNANCKAMTFVRHTSGDGGVCWLKDSVPAARFARNMISAVKKSR